MSTLLQCVRRPMFAIVATLMGLSLFAPIVAVANEPFVANDEVLISSGGSAVALRAQAGYDGEVLAEIPDGTTAWIGDSVTTAADGSDWYYSWVGERAGYLPANVLVAANGDTPAETGTESTEEPAAEETSPSIPWKEPIDFGVVVNNDDVEALPADGLACRVDASTDAEVLTRLGVGASLEITGDQVWAGDVAFYPVNCAGQGGFVRADYVQLDSAESVVEEPAVEEPVATEDDASDDVSSEEEVADTAGTGDLIVTQVDASGDPVADGCFQLLDSDAVVTEACDSNDAMPGNGKSGFFDIEAGTYSVLSLGSGDTQDVTIEADVQASATFTVEVAEDEATDEPVATDDVVATGEAPAEDTATEEGSAEEVPAEDVATEEVVVTEEAPAEDVTTNEDVATEEAPAEEVATEEVVTEEESAEEVPAEDVTTEEVVTEEESAEEVPAEDVTTNEDVATEEAPAEEVATEEVVTEEESVEEVPAEDVTTEEVAADEGESSATSTTSGAQQTSTTTAARNPVPEASNALGTAEVVDTNGDGLRCRVSADANSATISVLGEGTVVTVFAEAENGFLGIACGNELGYADVNFLFSGGAGEDIPANAGAVTVVGTGGGGLNCRSGAGTSSGVIALLAEGSSVTVRGASSGGWLPVSCAGQAGFVSIDYVEAGGSGADSGSDGQGSNVSTAANGVVSWTRVSGTNGDGVRCRTAAGTSSSVIAVIPEGTRVGTRGSSSNGWTPVRCYGNNGFVSSEYLSADRGSGSTNGGGVSSGNVTVRGTGGGGLNCRSSASMSGGVIAVVSEGSSLRVRGGASGGWQPVVCAGRNGFVSTDYISAGGSGSGSGSTNNGGGSSSVVSWTRVSGTNGDGVRCRTAAGTSSSVIAVIPEGTRVGARGSSSNGWTPVRCYGNNGFVSSQYLSADRGPGSSPAPPPPSSNGSLANGDRAQVTSNLNLRYSASTGAGVAAVAPAGTVVKITGGASSGFYPVDWDGLRGFMHGDYLTKTSAALSKRGGSAAPAPNPSPPDGGGGSATGNAMVDFAMRYEGYPYVWATRGPSSFDCSGFTYWITKNVLGRDIGGGLWTQVSAGTPVGKSNLQPGDLVFFQNTYKAGLSHVGLYIGGGQFIHAQNESTGVVISDLNSSYYGSRWYGAVRLT